MRKLFRIFCLLLVLLILPLPVLADDGQELCSHTVTQWEDSGETHTALCTLCGSTLSKPHEYPDFWKVSAAAHMKECLICGHITDDAAHTLPEGWEADASGHYRLCTVCQSGGQSQAHSFGKAELVFRTGRQEQTCTVCGYLHATNPPVLKALRIIFLCLAGAAALTAATVFTVRFIKKKKSKKANSRS